VVDLALLITKKVGGNARCGTSRGIISNWVCSVRNGERANYVRDVSTNHFPSVTGYLVAYTREIVAAWCRQLHAGGPSQSSHSCGTVARSLGRIPSPLDNHMHMQFVEVPTRNGRFAQETNHIYGECGRPMWAATGQIPGWAFKPLRLWRDV
jgi:hypothetical protein